MSRKHARITSLLVLILLILVSCSPKSVTEETQAAVFSATETTTVQQEPEQPLQETEQEPTSVPDEASAPAAEPPKLDEECIACHADKEKLIDTAKEEEVVEVENEGEG